MDRELGPYDESYGDTYDEVTETDPIEMGSAEHEARAITLRTTLEEYRDELHILLASQDIISDNLGLVLTGMWTAERFHTARRIFEEFTSDMCNSELDINAPRTKEGLFLAEIVESKVRAHLEMIANRLYEEGTIRHPANSLQFQICISQTPDGKVERPVLGMGFRNTLSPEAREEILETMEVILSARGCSDILGTASLLYELFEEQSRRCQATESLGTDYLPEDIQ